MINFRTSTTIAAVITALAMTGCAKDEKKVKAQTPLAGERVSVLTFQQGLEVDATLAAQRIALPRPYPNANWTQPGGSGTNAMYHLELGDKLAKAFDVSIGWGSDNYQALIAEPVIANGYIYSIDSFATVRAFKADTGASVWSKELSVKDRSKYKDAFGGGVTYGDGKVFANTGYGILIAYDAGTGKELWRHDAKIPLRSGPGYSNGRIVTITQDNQVIALNAETGSVLWDMVGTSENASILGSASPAFFGDVVVVALSSGEVFALQAENGRVIWQDQLSRASSLTPLSTLADVDGQPVIDRGRVYASSHSGRTVAIDLRTGERLWEANAGSTSTIWAAGDVLYMITNDQQLVALNSADGRVRFVSELQKYENPEKRKHPVRWAGPVLAGDRLIVASSTGYLLSVSPYTGKILSYEETDESTFITPIVANKTLYVLADDGVLTAWR